MAFRPNENLIDGELDNTTPGKVTGWIRFYRQGNEPLRVTLELTGDFHRDIQGRRIRISNPEPCERWPDRPDSYVDGLAPLQQGAAGDMTAGEEPRDYVDYPYIEWYSDANGRVVLELERSQLAILTDSPAFEVRRLDRGKQAQNMRRFVTGILKETGAQLGAVVKSKRKTGER